MLSGVIPIKELDTESIVIWEYCSSMEKDCDEIDFLKVRKEVKINQIPGQWVLGRKDCFTKAYNRMREKNASYSFYPESFVLPEDMEKLRKFMMEEKRIFLIKPVNWFSGLGIKITDSIGKIFKHKLFRRVLLLDDILLQGGKYLVQEYIDRPLLIKGRKFDVRLFLLITSVDPLIVYLYNDGLVGLSCEQFTMDSGELGNKYVHLSNYNINKNHDSFNFKEHRWKLSRLWNYLRQEHGVDTDKLWQETREVCLKTVFCCLDQLREEAKDKTKSHYNCFKLLSVDIMYDQDLKPWVLEVE